MSERLTITEALAEIKLAEKKIASTAQYIQDNLTTYEHLDHQHEGGLEEHIRQKIQSYEDLNDRLIDLRSKIATANLKTTLKVEGIELSIFHWLTWRREVATNARSLFEDCYSKISRATRENHTPKVYVDKDSEETKIAKFVAGISAPACFEKSQNIQELLDKLDGALSLVNATTYV